MVLPGDAFIIHTHSIFKGYDSGHEGEANCPVKLVKVAPQAENQ